MAQRILRRDKGFTLVELLLVVGIMMGLAILQFQKMRVDADEASAQQAGRDFGVVTEALQTYIQKHMAQFQKMNNAVAEPGLFPGACAPIDADTCKLDLAVLTREGLVNSGWAPFNRAIKTGYTAYVKRIPPTTGSTSTSDFDIEALVRTDAGWAPGGSGDIAWAMLGSAVKQAGPMAGVVRAGRADGLFGAWSMSAAKYPGMADGQLAGVVKVIAGSINQYVKVDGSLPMTGALNMGNNRINNVRDIQLLGPASLPRQGGAGAPMVSDMAPNWVLKGVFNVADYDADNVAGAVPRPVCPDSDASNGLPRILVKMSSLYNEMYGGMSGGQPTAPGDSQATMISKQTAAFGGWNFYALEDTSANVWRVYVRRFYDNGYIPGEALAEVYCYYP